MSSLTICGKGLVAMKLLVQMKKVASSIKTDFFRDFFTRKVEYEMEQLHTNLSKNLREIEYYQKKLEQLHRIQLVQNLYSQRIKVDGFKYSDPKI